MSKNLKEFQRWFSKDGSFIPSPGDAGYEGFVERRKAWQAALRWALLHQWETDDGAKAISSARLKRELEE